MAELLGEAMNKSGFNTTDLVGKPTHIIKVFSPDQCPFRYWAPYYHQWDAEDYCSYKRSLDKLGGHGNVSCSCVDGEWKQGCPLLKNDFQIVRT